jgi:DNA polymerase family A/Toprim domain/CHC2 zinc finger
MRIVYWDVETYSDLSLVEHGAYLYAKHSSTRPLVFCFAVDDGEVQTWMPGDPPPAVFHEAADNSDPAIWRFVSDNWTFENLILAHVLIPRHDFCPLPLEIQDCAQRLALANAYPAELGLRSEALRLPYAKDPAARQAMLRISRPKTAKRRRKVENTDQYQQDLALVIERCKRDVMATRACYNAPQLKHLLPVERELLLIDARINARGVRCNVPFLEAARELTTKERNAINTRLDELTCGAIRSVDQVGRIVKAVNERGHHLTSLAKRSVAAALAHHPDNYVQELLTLRQQGAYASVRKFKTFLNFADPDDQRVRDSLRIYGSATGRWSSLKPQLQNLKRNDAELPAFLVDDITAGNREALARFGNPLTLMGELSRAALCAADGNVLISADLGAIESRVLSWLAGEQWKLDAYAAFDRSGDKNLDVYRVVAHRMLHKTTPVSAITAAERQLGKCAELAFGFGGALGAWRKISQHDPRTDQEINAIIRQWRDAHPTVTRFWKELARAIRVAIRTEQPVLALPPPRPPIVAHFADRTLTLQLPSGRTITYPQARLTPNRKFEDGDPDIEFMDNARGQWKPVRAWFGTFVENCCGKATQVLTNEGWKHIVDIRPTDLIFDGVEWVTHGGIISRGMQETATLDGVPMTADHEVLTYERGWTPAASAQGLHRIEVRLPDGNSRRRHNCFARCKQTRRTTSVVASMRLQPNRHLCLRRSSAAPLLLTQLLSTLRINISEARTAWHEQAPGILGMALDVRSLSLAHASSLEELRRAWHHGVRALGCVRELLDRHGSDLSIRPDHRAKRQRRRLQPGQLLLGYSPSASAQQAHQSSGSNSGWRNDCRRSGRVFGSWGDDSLFPTKSRVAGDRSVHTRKSRKSVEAVFDILNCGPRHRFVVRGDTAPFIVHNCVQGTARDLLADALVRFEQHGLPVVFHNHDEVTIEVPKDSISEQDVLALLLEPPAWAQGLPLNGKVRSGTTYLEAPATAEPPEPESEAEIVEAAVDAFVADINVTPPTDADPADVKAFEKGVEEDFLASLGETIAPLFDLVSLPMDASRHVSCPFHDDPNPSCSIYADHYFCHACRARGDRLDWLTRVEGMTKAEAMAALYDWSADMPSGARAALQQSAEEKYAYVMRLWTEARALIGSLAEHYLCETRGIDVSKLPPTIHDALRFHPRCAFGARMYQPCLIALMRNPLTDAPVGIQRIGLAVKNGAVIKLDRMALGRMGVVKLWPLNGDRRLVVGEGIETVLAAATRVPYHGAPLVPAWSAVARDGLGQLPVLPDVERLILLVDHDENGEGQRAAETCRQLWKSAGRSVVPLTPKHPGWDFNDVVLGRKI